MSRSSTEPLPASADLAAAAWEWDFGYCQEELPLLHVLSSNR